MATDRAPSRLVLRPPPPFPHDRWYCDDRAMACLACSILRDPCRRVFVLSFAPPSAPLAVECDKWCHSRPPLFFFSLLLVSSASSPRSPFRTLTHARRHAHVSVALLPFFFDSFVEQSLRHLPLCVFFFQLSFPLFHVDAPSYPRALGRPPLRCWVAVPGSSLCLLSSATHLSACASTAHVRPLPLSLFISCPPAHEPTPSLWVQSRCMRLCVRVCDFAVA